jgi:hypothetical protein
VLLLRLSGKRHRRLELPFVPPGKIEMQPAKLPTESRRACNAPFVTLFLFPIVPGLFFLHPGEISAPASVPHVPRVSHRLDIFGLISAIRTLNMDL